MAYLDEPLYKQQDKKIKQFGLTCTLELVRFCLKTKRLESLKSLEMHLL
jgi:hypothetical protein